MTHFTVLACVDSMAALDDLMEPYSEQRDVEPYRSYEDRAPADHWAVKTLRKEAGLNPDDDTISWQEVAAAYNKHFAEDPPLEVDEQGRAYQMTSYNPESKWDWWVIGGRWNGRFPYFPEHRKLIINGGKGIGSEDTPQGYCDGGPKFALDLEKLREAARLEARTTYGKYVKLTEGTPEPLPWSTYLDNVSEVNGYTHEQARAEYHAQPRIAALKGSGFDDPFGDDPVEEFGVPEGVYVLRRVAAAVPGYALLTRDGRWMAPGKMGWFGMSDDSEGSRLGYWEVANAYIDSVPDDTILVMLDCHI